MDPKTDTEKDQSVEIVPMDQAISLITKAEIDTQIATAHAFPRSVSKFMKDVMAMATVTSDIAESCIYALPRGNKTVEGPSVRLAEMVASAYGNLRTGARVIFNDGKHVTAQGITHDLEKNIMHTEEVKRSILQNEYKWDDVQKKNLKTGRMVPMNEDMQTVTGRAACAIAYRNSVFKVVPAALIQVVIDKVREIIRGTEETLGARREKAMEYFKGLGVKDSQVFEALDVKGIEEIDLDKMVLLRGMATALKNGEATLESMFPPPDAKSKADKATKSTEDKLNKKKGGNGTAETADKMNNSLAETKDSQTGAQP